MTALLLHSNSLGLKFSQDTFEDKAGDATSSKRLVGLVKDAHSVPQTLMLLCQVRDSLPEMRELRLQPGSNYSQLFSHQSIQ